MLIRVLTVSGEAVTKANSQQPMIKFQCGNCGQQISCEEVDSGTSGFCPQCQSPVEVPGSAINAPDVAGSRTAMLWCFGLMVACAPFGQIGLVFSAFFHIAVAWFMFQTASALRWRLWSSISLSLIGLIPIVGAIGFLIVNARAREFLKQRPKANETASEPEPKSERKAEQSREVYVSKRVVLTPEEEIAYRIAKSERSTQRTIERPDLSLDALKKLVDDVDAQRKQESDHRLAWFISLAVAVPLLFALTFDTKHASAASIPWVFAGFLFPIHGAILLLRRGIGYSATLAILIFVSVVGVGREFSLLAASPLILVYLIAFCESIYVMCQPTETSSAGPTSIAALKWTCITILAVVVAVSFTWMNRLQFVTEQNNGKSRTRVFNRWSGEEIGSPKPWGL